MLDTKLLRQKILDLAIRGKLVPQDPTDEPASELLKKIKAEKDALVKAGKIKKDKHESHIFKGDDNRYYEQIDGRIADITDEIPFDLPSGWNFIRLKQAIQFVRNGITISQKKGAIGIPITRIETISKRIVDRNAFGYANIFDTEKYHEYLLQDKDILISHINSPKHLGKSAIYYAQAGEKILHGMNLLCIRSIPNFSSEFLFAFLQTSFFRGHVNKHMKHAVNQASITTSDIKEIIFPIPPLAEQQRIVTQIEALLKYVDVIDADAETLEKSITLAKQKILDLAIRGILVPQDPADEPASELLKKIKAEKDALVKAGKLKKDKHESYIFKSDDNCYHENIDGKVTDITKKQN